MGKASFCHIQDSKGKIQIYLKKDDLGDIYDAFRLLDIGDIIGIKGFIFRTKMGEISVHAQELKLLTKSLRPLPVVKEKTDESGKKVVFDPFADKELRYRQRYVDLVVNPAVRDMLTKRTMILRTHAKIPGRTEISRGGNACFAAALRRCFSASVHHASSYARYAALSPYRR